MNDQEPKKSAAARETEAYLARIRRTVRDAKHLISQAELRIAETDRMLAKQGLTREQVAALRFTEEQKAAVEAELKRRGLPSLAEMPEPGPEPRVRGGGLPPAPDADERDGTVANRRKKFGVMMQQFRL